MKSLKYRCLQDKEELLGGEKSRLIDNGGKILGVAHCDFVGCKRERKYRRKGHIVRSTVLDDRLGVHVMLDMLPDFGVTCDVLLTDDEEVGRSTAKDFQTEKEYNWIFSFDRRGAGAVCYDFDCMEEHAKEYFGEVHWGSFSDISYLEHLGVGGINVGTGYFNEHTKHSYADLRLTEHQVKNFARMFDDLGETRIEHVEKPKFYGRNYGRIHYGYGWGGGWELGTGEGYAGHRAIDSREIEREFEFEADRPLEVETFRDMWLEDQLDGIFKPMGWYTDPDGDGYWIYHIGLQGKGSWIFHDYDEVFGWFKMQREKDNVAHDLSMAEARALLEPKKQSER